MKEVADLLLLGIAIIFLIFASITDIKKKEVPNWLNFSLVAIALAIRGIGALIFKDFSYFYWALIAVAIFYVLGEIFFYNNIFGGGDAKLFVALAAVFATRPYFVNAIGFGLGFKEPFLLTFMINALFLGSVWGVIVSIFIFIKMPRKKFFMQFNSINKKLKWARIISLVFALISIIFTFILNEAWFIIMGVMVLILPSIYSFLKVIENNQKRLMNPKDLAEGDYLYENARIGKTIIKKSVHGLSKKQINLLRKVKKKVWVNPGLIFVPIILIALIISLFYGNLLFLIIQGILS